MLSPTIISPKTTITAAIGRFTKPVLWRLMWEKGFYRTLTLWWMGSAVILFIVFKQLYPFADYFSDSYSYLLAAKKNLDISAWPIGYSKFLRMVHYFSSYDTVTIACQYIALQLATFFFFLTIVYWANISRTYQLVLFIGLLCNPLLFYVSNYINSDPLFWALSLGWFTQLIWILARPSYKGLVLHALLLFFVFTVRNNAYYYPIISIISIGFSRHRLWVKIAGAALGLIPITLFIMLTRQAANKITGEHQFSLFTGWQLANNAMYMYPYITVENSALPTAETKELDRLTKVFYKDKVPAFKDTLNSYTGNYFIREPKSPLKKYLVAHYPANSNNEILVGWGKSNAVFADYGNYLIKHHPFAYLRHFATWNAVNYLMPPLEKLTEYNLGMHTVSPIAQDWFEYMSPDVTAVSFTAQKWMAIPYQFLCMFLNCFVLGGLIWLTGNRNRHLLTAMERRIIGLAAILLLLNFGFTVLATINVLRYQLFPMSISMALVVLLVPKMLSGGTKGKDKKEISGM